MKPEEYIWDYRNPYLWMDRVMRSAFPPMIITCAITGGVQGKESNEYLPESAEEQADAVYEAYKAGAVSVHMHARDPNNLALTTKNPEDYSRINKLIRERCPDIIINNTTGGGPWLSTEERMCCLFADPEAGYGQPQPRPLRPQGPPQGPQGAAEKSAGRIPVRRLHSRKLRGRQPLRQDDEGKRHQAGDGALPARAVLGAPGPYPGREHRCSLHDPVRHGVPDLLLPDPGQRAGPYQRAAPQLHVRAHRRGAVPDSDERLLDHARRTRPRGHGGQPLLPKGRKAEEERPARGADHHGSRKR